TMTTSTPLHALTTLNDPTWVEAARNLASRCLKQHSTVEQQLSAAFRQVVCRTAGDSELLMLRRAFDKQLAIYRADPKSAGALLGVGASPRDESLPVVEHAALTTVCLGILNLDEALTRE
ncbi:MAG: DUF1553 domain-containing protein, partial [Planctomycetaceae bacterium]|nr:DUF1553 domain-containing protein [Planctomycetaceae bacterium]